MELKSLRSGTDTLEGTERSLLCVLFTNMILNKDVQRPGFE